MSDPVRVDLGVKVLPQRSVDVVLVDRGPQGVRGSRWFTESEEFPDPSAVEEPVEGDQFFYPESGVVWRWDGSEWLESADLTGPVSTVPGPAIGGILTTKGDLVARDATAAVRVPVGTAGQVLTADPAAAAGVAWGTRIGSATPPAPVDGISPPSAVIADTVEIRALSWTSFGVGIGAQEAVQIVGNDCNTAVGGEAQKRLVSGIWNTAVGFRSQPYLTAGNYNTAVGRSAHWNLETGSRNTAYGVSAGYYLREGSNNTHLGCKAGSDKAQAPHVDGTVAIGADSDNAGAYTDRDNTIVLGTEKHTVIMRGPGKGIEMRSPDGTRYLLTVANGGTLQIELATEQPKPPPDPPFVPKLWTPDSKEEL